MAGYGYSYRGSSYTTYSPLTEGWNKTSYNSNHVCQPAIIDAEGRRKPIISYTPNGNTEYYVKTEIIEPVPLVTGYKQTTPVKVEVPRDYNDGEGKWNRTSSPEKWHRPSSPEKWHRPSSPVRYRAEEKWVRPTSPVHDRPQQVEEFLTKIQTEASRPNNNSDRFGPLSATHWHQKPNSYHVNNTGYGDHHSDLSNKEYSIRNESYDGGWGKPSSGSWSPPKKDHQLSKPTNDINTAMEHLTEAVKPSSGITNTKPSHGGWSTPQGANLSKATSDINTSVEYLKEVVRPSSGVNSHQPYRYSVTPTGPKRDFIGSRETIDSREAARRYGNMKFASSRPVDYYTATIDSREATRNYGGRTV